MYCVVSLPSIMMKALRNTTSMTWPSVEAMVPTNAEADLQQVAGEARDLAGDLFGPRQDDERRIDVQAGHQKVARVVDDFRDALNEIGQGIGLLLQRR